MITGTFAGLIVLLLGLCAGCGVFLFVLCRDHAADKRANLTAVARDCTCASVCTSEAQQADTDKPAPACQAIEIADKAMLAKLREMWVMHGEMQGAMVAQPIIGYTDRPPVLRVCVFKPDEVIKINDVLRDIKQARKGGK